MTPETTEEESGPGGPSRREFLRKIGLVAAGAVIPAAAGCRKSPTPPPATVQQVRENVDTGSPRFEDITRAVGLDFTQYNGGCGMGYFVEQVASGAAIFDANGDGFLDIYFPQPKPIGLCRKKYHRPL